MSKSEIFTCEEALCLLDSYVDGEVTDREAHAVDQHLKICESCAKLFKSEKAVLQLLRKRIQSLNVPTHLLDTVLERLDKED